MSFFNVQDHQAVLSFEVSNPHAHEDVARVYHRMSRLRQDLSRKLKLSDTPLHLYGSQLDGISQETVSSTKQQAVMTMLLSRSVNAMQTIESNMGHDGIHLASALKARRHPVIELRLAPDHLAVELILSPDAWWDQQNFVGKFTLHEQRVALYEMLRAVENEFCVGFWPGVFQEEMHLSTKKLPPFHLVSEFLGTFAAGRDYLRIGKWYDVEDPALSEETIVSELHKTIVDLSSFYDYVLWTSNNNYHSFYRKLHKILS